MEILNIYGSIIQASNDSIARELIDEYWFFKHTKASSSLREQLIDIEVSSDKLPIRRYSSPSGIEFNLDKFPSIVRVRVNPVSGMGYYIAWFLKGFLFWSDKALIHAAGISDKYGNGVLIFGVGGIGKTILSIYLASNGYYYMGDDWILIDRSGFIKPFITKITIYPYHLSILPQVRSYMFKREKIKALKLLTAGYIINHTPYPIKGLFELKPVRHKVKPEDVVNDLKIAFESKLKYVLYLKKGRGFSISEVDKIDRYIEELADIASAVYRYELHHVERAYYLLKSLKITNSEYFEDRVKHIKNIYRDAFEKLDGVYKVELPDKPSSDEYLKITEFISKHILT